MSDPFRLVSFPQDMTIADKDGMLTPAWYRALAGITGLVPKLNEDSVRQDEALSTAKTSLEATDASLSASVANILSGFEQPPIADLATPGLTVSSSYTEAEIIAIRDRLVAAESAVNLIIEALRTAQIVREE